MEKITSAQINSAPVRAWVESKNPCGRKRLSLRANISMQTVKRALGGDVLRLDYIGRIAEAIGCSEFDLYQNNEAQAS